MHMSRVWMSLEEGVKFLEFWEPNSGPLEREQVLLTAESAFLPKILKNVFF